jgi:hypothetical protein
MDLMCRHFYKEDQNLFLLNIMQLVRISWRDERAPSESLSQFYQRFQQHLREASAHYGGTITPLPEITARLLFVSGLPQEVQSLITTQKIIVC